MSRKNKNRSRSKGFFIPFLTKALGKDERAARNVALGLCVLLLLIAGGVTVTAKTPSDPKAFEQKYGTIDQQPYSSLAVTR